MSAGMELEELHGAPTRTDRMDLLAPLFRRAVEAAIAECRSSGLAAKVFETYRPNALQAIYYARGRTVKPPTAPVTHAISNLNSWHGYGLAVDVIHETEHWSSREGRPVSRAAPTSSRNTGANGVVTGSVRTSRISGALQAELLRHGAATAPHERHPRRLANGRRRRRLLSAALANGAFR
jgi:hypothetical protein